MRPLGLVQEEIAARLNSQMAGGVHGNDQGVLCRDGGGREILKFAGEMRLVDMWREYIFAMTPGLRFRIERVCGWCFGFG
jgi:hypothetical protein